MKKEYINFLCELHGYLIRVKEIHWSTDNNSEHLLCDEIEDDIHGCEDRFAECAMGMEDTRIRVGQLLPILPNAENLFDMLKELEEDVMKMKKKLTGPENGGLFNILDDIQECCNKYKYRSKQK